MSKRALDLRTRTSSRFNLKIFARVLQKKKTTQKAFILLFSTKKVSTVIYTEEV